MPPRPLRPKDEPDASEDNEPISELKVGRRKAVSSACIPCRKRKSKCDGAVPSCSTCTAVYRTECNYDADSEHKRKGVLKKEAQSPQQNDALDVIFSSLRNLPEDESISLLQQLRSNASPDGVAASLRNNVKLPPRFAPQTLEADFTHQPSQSANTSASDLNGYGGPRSNSSGSESRPISGVGSPADTPAAWFRQPQDAEFVEHLLNHYFCWVHPFHQLFSRDHFLHDMGRGKHEFCSALLVNAMLAFACQYSDRPLARADPTNSNTAGDHFFAEAKRLLEHTDEPSITTVQALGIMSLRESSQGRDSAGYQYSGRCVRMALELGLHLSVSGSGLRASEIEVRRVTFWGVFNLETQICVGVGRLSQLPRAAADIQRPMVNDRTENQTWRPYEDANISSSPSAEQPLRPTLFMDQMSKLSELASDMVNTFYTPQERFTSRRLAAAYSKYQEWYQNLPECFRLENTALPHVLVLHMYYYACVLHLFRPYIKLELQGANLYPRSTCTQCANKISSLMNALRAMYGLRRVSPAVTNILLSASTIHLLNLPSEPSGQHLSQGLSDLHTMSTNHYFALRCIDIIRSLASKWNITLPDGAASVLAFKMTGQKQWPSPTSSTFWAASMPRELSSVGGRSSGSASSQHDSPFLPPAAQSWRHPSVHSQYSDSPAPMDTSGMSSSFWSSFPAPSMPVAPHHVVPSMSMSTDMPGIESTGAQWQAFSAGPTDVTSHPLQHTAGVMDDGMGFSNWAWQ